MPFLHGLTVDDEGVRKGSKWTEAEDLAFSLEILTDAAALAEGRWLAKLDPLPAR